MLTTIYQSRPNINYTKDNKAYRSNDLLSDISMQPFIFVSLLASCANFAMATVTARLL